MRIGKNIVAMANAGLGASDAITLTKALKKYAPASRGKCQAKLLSILGDRVVFAGKSSVAFVSEAVAREVILGFYRPQQPQAPVETASGNDIASVREEIAQLRSEIMAEIAKVRSAIEQVRGDIDALRKAQLAEKTEREKNHDAIVEMLAEIQGR